MEGNGDQTKICYTPYLYISNTPEKESKRLELLAKRSSTYDDNSSSFPPSYDSIFGQFKDEKQNSGGSLEYLKTILVMFAGTGLCIIDF